MNLLRGLAIPAVVFLGCTSPPSGPQPDPVLVEKVEKLEQDNRDLQDLLRAQDAEYDQATKALAEITKALSDISQEESAIVQLRYSIEFGSEIAESLDLKEEALSRIRQVQQSLEQARQTQAEATSRLRHASLRNQELVHALQEMEHALSQKDAVIAKLQDDIQAAMEASEVLRRRLEERETELDTARAELEAERNWSYALEEDLGKGYIFVGTKKDLLYMKRLSVLAERGDVYSPVRALSNSSIRERYFQELDLRSTEIPLGSGFREARIVSSHREHPELFQQQNRGYETVLLIHDPVAFWAISHYLVVRILP